MPIAIYNRGRLKIEAGKDRKGSDIGKEMQRKGST
jgi:hypothetical protein